MTRNLKFFLFLFIGLITIKKVSAQEISNYQDISIKANHVTLNKFTNQLLLKTDVQISFGNYTLYGDSAILSYDEDKLVIDGFPASILSSKENIVKLENRLGHAFSQSFTDKNKRQLSDGRTGRWKEILKDEDLKFIEFRLNEFDLKLDNFILN